MDSNSIHKRLRKLAILLETCQDELATLTHELSDVSIEKNQPSTLTQQFMAMSPSEPSPPHKRRDVKKTPNMVKEVAARPKRIQPTLVAPSNLTRSCTMVNGAAPTDWAKKEAEWHKRRRQQEKKPLESLAQPKEYHEVTTSDEEEEEEASLADAYILKSFMFKAKGFRKENTKDYIRRLFQTAINVGLNPFKKIEGLEFVFEKLGRVKRGYGPPSKKELLDAFKSQLLLKQLWTRLLAFINDDDITPNLKV
jgi:hypothetical protein